MKHSQIVMVSECYGEIQKTKLEVRAHSPARARTRVAKNSNHDTPSVSVRSLFPLSFLALILTKERSYSSIHQTSISTNIFQIYIGFPNVF